MSESRTITIPSLSFNCGMSETTCYMTRGLQFTARCDFCGKSAKYIWLLFESADGKKHICNECVYEMMKTMYCVADGDEETVRDGLRMV